MRHVICKLIIRLKGGDVKNSSVCLLLLERRENINSDLTENLH